MTLRNKLLVATALYCALVVCAVGGYTSSNASTPPLRPPMPPSAPKLVANYSYMVYSDGEVFTRYKQTIMSNGSLAVDDMLFTIKYCPPNSSIICIHGVNFDYDFAIPRGKLKLGEEWSFAGLRFRLLPSVTFMAPSGLIQNSEKPIWNTEILGQSYTYYVVASLGDKGRYPEHLFFYSPERGLIGEADPSEEHNLAPCWLVDKYGPGSKEYDSQITDDAFLSKDEVSKLMQGIKLQNED